MPSLTITTRRTRSGDPRYVVRYRLGGRAYPVQHGGSFGTLKEAKARRDLIGGLIATGQNPAVVLYQQAEQPQRRTFAQVAEEYRRSRVDAAPMTVKAIGSHLATFVPMFGAKAPDALTAADVQAWIAGTTLKPTSVRRYIDTLRSILDYAGVDPNPARDSRVRLPRVERVPVNPPSAADVEAIITHAKPKWRLLLEVLAATGMRIGELHSLEFQDVDIAASRFRVRQGKTFAARRWVAVPEPLMTEIAAATPPDDRTAERRVFPGASEATVHKFHQTRMREGGHCPLSPA
jgi:integrase